MIVEFFRVDRLLIIIIVYYYFVFLGKVVFKLDKIKRVWEVGGFLFKLIILERESGSCFV